jgi:DNA-binding protein H-NS
MPRLNLKSMSASDLIDLRDQVNNILSGKVSAERKALEQSLRRLDAFGRGRAGKAAKAHALAGKKVAPKYKGPNGETWTGRGLKPRWLAEALQGGSKIEDFLIASADGEISAKGRKATKRK